MNPLSIQSLQQSTLEALQEVEKNYPYFLLPKMFRLRQYHQSRHAEFEPCLHKTAIYAYNRKALYNFIHTLEEATPLTSTQSQAIENEKPFPIAELGHSAFKFDSLKQDAIEPKPEKEKIEEKIPFNHTSVAELTNQENTTNIDSTDKEPKLEETIIIESDQIETAVADNSISEGTLLKETIVHESIESLSQESLIEENNIETVKIQIQPPQLNIKEIEATVYENLKDILETENRKKTDSPSAEEVLEAASENSFLQWLKIIEKDKIAIHKKEPAPAAFKSPLSKTIQDLPEKEQKIKVKKDPELDALDGFVKDQIKRKKKKSAHVIEIPFEQTIEKSTQPQEIYTEGLAKLLTKQGKYEKAIDMYEKLILKYPEKSSFFAVQIKLIKDLNS